jgi:hypothetical protein
LLVIGLSKNADALSPFLKKYPFPFSGDVLDCYIIAYLSFPLRFTGSPLSSAAGAGEPW